MSAVHVIISTTDGDVLELIEVQADDKVEPELAAAIRHKIEDSFEFNELSSET